MTIHQNLKRLRQLTGMTQEDVAARVGVTRQAISGYESGRRQPDLDMLERFAALYETDILEILYGTSARQTAWRRFRRAAAVTLVLPILLLLLRSCLLLAMNRLLPMMERSFVLTGVTRPMVEAHMKNRMMLVRISDALGSLSNLAALVGCIVLAVLAKDLRPSRSVRASLLYPVLFLVGSVLVTVPLSLPDPYYALFDYVAYIPNSLWPFLVLAVYCILLTRRQSRDSR